MTAGNRRLAIALLVSLTVNAFLLGGLLAHFGWGHRDHLERGALSAPLQRRPPAERRMRRGPPDARLLRDVMQALGGPKDARVREALERGRPGRALHRERMERAQSAVRAALSAEPYDEEQLARSLVDLRAAAESGQMEAQQTLVRLARQLRPAERARLRPVPPGP